MEEFIKIEKLKGKETFQLWKCQINAIFKSQGLQGEAKGTLARSKEKVEDMLEWDKKDGSAQKYILTTIEKRLVTHIMKCDTAKEMMEKLEQIFEKGDTKKKCTLMQEFFSLTHDKSDTISEHVSKVENMAYRINGIENNSIKDEMIISKILTTLPKEYEYFLSAWESAQESEQTLENLTSRLMGEELRIVKIKGANQNSANGGAGNNKRNNKNGFNYKEK